MEARTRSSGARVAVVLAAFAGACVSAWASGCSGGDAPARPSDPPARPAVEIPGAGDAASADVRAAVERARAAVVARPDDAQAWYALAETLEANAFLVAARQAYLGTTARDPEHPRAWYHAARLAAQEGELEAALDASARALAVDDAYAPTWWRRGNWFFELGLADEARDAFERAAELAPRDRAPIWGLARLALEAGDDAGARALLEPLAAAERGPSYTFHLLATAHRRLGNLDMAERLAERAAQPAWIDPWKVDVRARRAGYHDAVDAARADAARGAFDAARARLEGLLAEDAQDVPVRTMLASVMLAERRPDEALALLDEGLAERPDHYRLHYNRALALGALGRFEEQLAAAERALELQGVFAPAWYAAARANAALGRHAAAVEAFERALDYGPDDPRVARQLEEARAALRASQEGGR